MNKECKILITGDFCPINRIEELVDQFDGEAIFNDFLPLISRSDLAIINLECPLTDSDESIYKTGPTLKASPNTATILAKAGFRIATIANNHIMDFGPLGLKQTIDKCQSNNIHCVGAGENLENARQVLTVKVRTTKFAIINFTENEFSTTHGNYPGANPLDIIENYRDIKMAKENADFVLVIVHGGNEMYNLPSPRLKKTYRFFAEAGANAIVGHHSHIPSGYEVYKGVPIFYSLGNFIFDYPKMTDTDWNSGYAVELTLGNDLKFQIIPYEQCNLKVGVHLLENDRKEQFLVRLSNLSNIILNDSMLRFEFESFCNQKSKMYLSYLEPHSSMLLHFLRNRKLFPSFLTRRKKKLYLNLIRCESHRDIILDLLDKEVK